MNDERHYLDTASTVPLHPAARDTLLAALVRGYADPRRLHHEGRDARLLLDNARAVVADALSAHPDEIGFTSSGTDAVHRGLLGLVTGRDERAGIVHSTVEHSSVLHAVQWRDGHSAGVPVDATGRVDLAEMDRLAAEPDVAVVALQAANQEVGTLQPVDDLDVPAGTSLFVDAAAAAGHVPLPRRWDVLTASAHKWGGPAGVGVLAVRRKTHWTSPFPGDHGLDSPGFANVPAALAAAAALQAVVADQETSADRRFRQVERIRQAVALLPDTEVLGDPVRRLPHLVTFSCLYVAGDELVHALDRRGFAVASGSACTASTLEPSHVLAAMGALTHGNVRVSVGATTSDDEVEAFCAAVTEVVTEIRRSAGL
ncbi:cysteine desulfurase family protein [Nocardioides montaniterrae]